MNYGFSKKRLAGFNVAISRDKVYTSPYPPCWNLRILPGSSLVNLVLFLVSPRYPLTNYSLSLAARLGELSVPKAQNLFKILMSKYLHFLLMEKILGKLSLLFYFHLWMGRLPNRPNLKNWFKWSIKIKWFFRKQLEGQSSG